MIKITEHEIRKMEEQRPGITEQIWDFENMDLPACPVCGSTDTASVQAGVIGRTMNINLATTKIHSMLNWNGKGIYFCNVCRQQFGPSNRTVD